MNARQIVPAVVVVKEDAVAAFMPEVAPIPALATPEMTAAAKRANATEKDARLDPSASMRTSQRCKAVAVGAWSNNGARRREGVC